MFTLNQSDVQEKKVYKPNIRSLHKMDYLEILDNYQKYPDDRLSFSLKWTKDKKNNNRYKFLSEEDKAFCWKQNFSKQKKLSKFLQCNLHHVPENLWDDLYPVLHENIIVGYKVSDNNVNFFVHKADTDDMTRELFNEIKLDNCDKDFPSIPELYDKVNSINNQLIEKGIESWMTIRASKLLEGRNNWLHSITY